MKVLIIAPFFFERHRWMMSAYKTALNLSKKMKVVVLTTGQPKYEIINPNLKVYRMWDIFLPDPVNYSIVPGLIPHLEKVIHLEKPDIFLVNKHMFFTSLAVAWLKLRGKKVICATDTFPGLNWFPKNKLVGLVMKIYSRLIGLPLLKMSNKVVLFHEGLVEIGEKLGLNYQVIHNGVDLDRIDTAEPISQKNKLVTVTYVGRLESVKGYRDLLTAAQKICQQRQDIQFLLVGDTAGKEMLVSKYQSERIKFLGFRKDIPSILKASDIFVMPSYAEGLPNALMEAMASQNACLTSRVGGMKILIKPEETGIFFEPGNVNELTSALERLADDKKLRRQLGKKARQKIEAEFSWQIITRQYIKLFQELTNV